MQNLKSDLKSHPKSQIILPKSKIKSNHNFNHSHDLESLKVLLHENTVHQTITPKQLHSWLH